MGGTVGEILDHLSELNRRRSALEADHVRALAEYQKVRAGDGVLAERSMPDEIALELHISRGYAEAQLALAKSLTERLPGTLEALSTGQVDLGKARALVEVTA